MSETRRPGKGHFIKYIFSLGDLFVVNMLFWLTITVFPTVTRSGTPMRELWLLINVSYLPVLFYTQRARHELRAISMERVMRTTLAIVGSHALVFLSMLAFLGITALGGKAILFYYLTMTLSMPLYRLTASAVLKEYRRRGHNFSEVLIVGTGETARRLYDAMQTDAGYGYCVVGFFDNNPAPDFDIQKVMPIDTLADFLAHNRVREIYFTLSGHNQALQRVIKIADDNVAEFYYVPQLPRTLTRGMEYHNIGHIPVLSIRRNPLKSSLNRGIKRAFDIVFSGAFLCVYPLIYIPVAIAIKLSSPGPVYFRQERTGYLGKSFVCYKFRTMKVGASSDQATRVDPRKTRVGDFLRRTSLDELPQFINVFKGEMSVVGPRPHMLAHTEIYTQLVDSYMLRHAVKPGITGWAQVNGYRGLTDELWKMERRVEHDMWYIENWNFFLDLKIIVRTVFNAIHGEQNAF